MIIVPCAPAVSPAIYFRRSFWQPPESDFANNRQLLLPFLWTHAFYLYTLYRYGEVRDQFYTREIDRVIRPSCFSTLRIFRSLASDATLLNWARCLCVQAWSAKQTEIWAPHRSGPALGTTSRSGFSFPARWVRQMSLACSASGIQRFCLHLPPRK